MRVLKEEREGGGERVRRSRPAGEGDVPEGFAIGEGERAILEVVRTESLWLQKSGRGRMGVWKMGKEEAT